MHDGVEPIAYYKGIFDKFKSENNLDKWNDLGFPDLMWGLGFEMDCHESYKEFLAKSDFHLKDPETEREKKRNYLYVLEHSNLQIVGNFLFSYWRFLTHWTYGYTDYDVDFLCRIIAILEKEFES